MTSADRRLNPQFDISVAIGWIRSAVEELREHGLSDDEIRAELELALAEIDR